MASEPTSDLDECEVRARTIAELTRQLQQMERSGSGSGFRPRSELGTGIRPLDSLLPEGGLRPGTLVEWLGPASGSGVAILMYRVAAQLTRDGGNLVVVDPAGEFYPPGVDCVGVDLQRTVLVRPANERDALWAYEQALRSTGVAVALCCFAQLSISPRIFRRMQLAVERGGGVGLVHRAVCFRDQPSWADIRFNVTPIGQRLPGRSAVDRGRRLLLELLRCRGQGTCHHMELELNDETGDVRVVTRLAATETVRRAAGA